MASGNIDKQFYNGYTLRLKWTETSVDVAGNRSTVQVIAQLITKSGGNYYIDSNTQKDISITCNGSTQSGKCSVKTSAGTTKNLFTATFSIPHNSDGTKTVTISCRLKILVYFGGSLIENVDVSGSAVLDKIARTPNAPNAFAITAGYGNYVGLGDEITLKWAGASGVITGYELQYKRGNSGWKTWKTISTSSTIVTITDSFTSTDIDVNGAGCAVQYRVRALNGTLASGWMESNVMYILGGMDLKVNGKWLLGSVWIKVDGVWKRAKRVWIKINGNWTYSR